MIVKLINVTRNPVYAIEQAASICYDSSPASDGRIMDNCYDSGHHSVLEFAQFHFHIEGISRACSHQLVRHRTASFAQRSQRYCKEDNFRYITPKSIENNPTVKEEYDKLQRSIRWFYDFALHNKIPAEDARYILSNATETVIDMSVDFRNLIHFMNDRLCRRAQWEIRELANLMRNEVIMKYPSLTKYLVPKCEQNLEYPFCTENKSCGRHKKLSEVYKDE